MDSAAKRSEAGGGPVKPLRCIERFRCGPGRTRVRSGWAAGLLAGLCLTAVFPQQSQAQFRVVLDEIIDDIRGIAGDVLRSEEIGSAYAAMINFAGNPDVSTATYYIDGGLGEDATLNVFRASLRHEFGHPRDQWRPFVQVLLPYQTLEYYDTWDVEDRARVEWQAFGAVGTLGFQYSFSEHLKVTPALNLGSVRLKTNAGYQGVFAETILAPALRGLAYDWTADAVVFGGTVWLDYKFPYETFDIAVHAGLTQNWIRSYYVSDEAISFSSFATTLSGNVETIHPTGIQLGGYPLSLVLSGGGTAFLGPGKDALGFDRFANAGVAFQADISRIGLPVRTLRLGAMGIAGPNVLGWSILFNYEF